MVTTYRDEFNRSNFKVDKKEYDDIIKVVSKKYPGGGSVHNLEAEHFCLLYVSSIDYINRLEYLCGMYLDLIDRQIEEIEELKNKLNKGEE